jgi:hypothetical protein
MKSIQGIKFGFYTVFNELGQQLNLLRGSAAVTAVKRLLQSFSRSQRSNAPAPKHEAEPKNPIETVRGMRNNRNSQPAIHNRGVGLPIVFIHHSNSSYLQYSLAQAAQLNPRSKIYLLGDVTNNCYDLVEHHLFSDYFQEAAEFSKIYVHRNTLNREFNLFDLQRWIILKEFLLSNKIDKCLYIDSDTLLYTDVTEDSKKFQDFDFAISHGMSGCTFFLNRVEALVDFCNFLFDIYLMRDKYHHDKMVAHFAARRRNRLSGGVCDMTAFQLYKESHFGEVGEVAQIIDGSVYDPSITVSWPGFEMENGIKRIVMRNGVPFGRHVRSDKEIKFNSLQFQGRAAKSLMSQFYTGNTAQLAHAAK